VTRPLRIAVDAHNLVADWRGIGRYLRAILARFVKRDDVALTLLVNDRFPVLARRRLEAAAGGHVSSVARRLPLDADVMWSPWNGTFFASGDVPAVVTMHDAVPFVSPASDPRRRESVQQPFRRSAEIATLVIANSAFTAREIERELHVAPERTRVTLLGVEPIFSPANELVVIRDETDENVAASEQTTTRARCNVSASNRLMGASVAGAGGSASAAVALGVPRDRSYILYVGALEPRKNFATLAAAHARAFAGGDVALVCAGDRPSPAPNVIALGPQEPPALAELYRGALLTAVPSLYEGFGFPALESMACGTPVLASRGSSLDEVCGDAAAFVADGASVDAWCDALCRLADRGDERATLRSRGLTRAATFSWDRCADETLAVLWEAAARR